MKARRRPGARLAPAIFTLGALCLMAPEPVGANPLIQQAREAGVLDVDTALLYRVYDLLDPDRLPEHYRTEPQLEFCGTPLLVEANHHRSGKRGVDTTGRCNVWSPSDDENRW